MRKGNQLKQLLTQLANHPIFSNLGKPELEEMAQKATLRNFKVGDWIVHHGEPWPYLFLVKTGQVTAVKESFEGRSLTLATITRDEIFWGLAFFIEEAPMPAALKATTECELLLWARNDILSLIQHNGQFSWELSRLAILRVQFASEIVEQLAFQPLTGRIAKLLLEQFPASQPIAPRHLTLDEMATRVGTTREMVCRILYRFAEEGAIRINRTEFIFTDRSLLEEHTHRS